MGIAITIFLIWFFWAAITDGIFEFVAFISGVFLVCIFFYFSGVFFLNSYIALPRTFFLLGLLICFFIASIFDFEVLVLLWPFFYSFLYVLNSNLAYIYDESWVRSTGIINNIEILSYFRPRSYIEVYIKVFSYFPNAKFFTIDVSLITVFILSSIFIFKKYNNKEIVNNFKIKPERFHEIKNEDRVLDYDGNLNTYSNKSLKPKNEWSPPVSIICLKCGDSMRVKLKTSTKSEEYTYRCIKCKSERKLLNSDL